MAAAMIGAGVLSVLVYPLIAVGLHRSAPLTPADIQAAAPTATGTNPRRITPASLSQIASAQSRLPISIASWGGGPMTVYGMAGNPTWRACVSGRQALASADRGADGVPRRG
jgi:hypothetical protein